MATNKEPLQPGDRVRVYCARLNLFGDKATVEGLLPDNRLYAQLDNPTPEADTPRLHAKQCRRLTPKKRREFRIATGGGCTFVTNRCEATHVCKYMTDKCILVREVLPRGEK